MKWNRLSFSRGLVACLFMALFGTVASIADGNNVCNVVVAENYDDLLPVRNLVDRQIVLVNIGVSGNTVFQDYCSFYADLETIDTKDTRLHEIDKDALVIAAVYSVSKASVETYRGLLKDHDVVAVFFISEKSVAEFEGHDSPEAVILAGAAFDQSQIMAAEAIFGGDNISGISKTRLGFATPESKGFSPRMEARIDSVVDLNIRRRSFPGCQVVVVKDGDIVLDKAYGHLSYEKGAQAVNNRTMYDIASMTKATATVAGLMLAYDKGLYRLDDPVSGYLPRLKDTDKADITIREMMHHESGLPSTLNTYALMVDSASFTGRLLKYKCVAPYTVKVDKGVYGNKNARLRTDIFRNRRCEGYETEIARGIFGGAQMKEVIDSAIYSAKLGSKKYLYSCLNFCILKEMEEKLTGVAHDRLLDRNVFQPIGAYSTMFRPSEKVSVAGIAPTEKDGFLRRQTLQGFVHDEIAAYSGGVQGNAGLFSTAEDIAKLCQTWLNGGSYGGVRIFSEPTVRLFMTEKSTSSDRGLGFDRATRLRAMAKIGMPESVIGHTGFTGTCFWIDPENDIVVVFLCNRVNPSRDNAAFNELVPRTEIMRIVYDSLVK